MILFRKYLFLLMLFLSFWGNAQLPQIGSWRTHLTYKNNYHVTQGLDKVFFANATNIIQFNTADKTTKVWDKTNGLSDNGVDALCFDNKTNQLMIAYKNSNIDLIGKNKILNISDFKKKNITGDKKIYEINFHANKAYLSTGLGLLIYFMDKNEFGDLVALGAAGANIPIKSSVVLNDTIYVLTNNELFKCALNKNLNFLNNWQISIAPSSSKRLLVNDNVVYLETINDIKKWNGLSWNNFYSDGFINEKTQSSEGKFIIAQSKPGRKGRVVTLNKLGVVEKINESDNFIHRPIDATVANNIICIADEYEGSVINDGQLKNINPQGPNNLPEAEIFFYKDKLIVCGGAVSDNWQYKSSSAGMMEYDYKAETWNGFSRIGGAQILDTLLDYVAAVVDKTNETLYAASYGGGLLSRDDKKVFKVYKESNSTIRGTVGDPASYRVAGVAFDSKNNLWLSNFGAINPLVLKISGSETWKNFSFPFFIPGKTAHQILIDDYDKLWIVCHRNGLICYDPGEKVDNASDDKWRHFVPGNAASGLPQGNIICVAKDKEGYLWVGTENGIAHFYCAEDAFNLNCKMERTVVKNGNFNGYLLGQEFVNCIAVDGANRKWVGTKNGVWLLSADGTNVVERFTTENSFLLDNQIRKIAIEPNTGEVFFLTFKGLCSFRGSATEAVSQNDAEQKIVVFPNPVNRNFNGSIGIKNLPNNSTIKIIKANGQLIFSTKSLGGQAVWNKRLTNGETVASGVYNLIVSDSNNKFYSSSKIIIE